MRARKACWRKSGVVSITTFCPTRDSNRDGRNLLSCKSREVHTRQWQPSEGTPMEVPEPSTVSLIGAPCDSADIGENGVVSKLMVGKCAQKIFQKIPALRPETRRQGISACCRLWLAALLWRPAR